MTPALTDDTGREAAPLDGIRVLELGNFIAAPSAGRLLAEFGADVMKIEQPEVGDQIRRWRLFRGETSMLWRTMARNKRSVTIDLRVPEGQELVRRLAAQVDIVLENYRPGKLESWGLSPDELRRDNPQLVVVRISGYGQTGPYRDRPGFGGVAEAMGGLRFVTGYPDRPPTRLGISIGDTLAGLHGVIGALLGLLERRAGEVGETVDVSLQEAVLTVMESVLPDHDAYQTVRSRTGNSMPGVAPSNTYACAEGAWVVIGGNADAIFRRLMIAIGHPDIAQDPRYRDNLGRVAHAKHLDALIEGWTSQRALEEVMQVMLAAGVPAGPILSAAEVVADPHLRARGMLVELPVVVDGDEETVTFTGVVPKLEQRPGSVRWLGPELGEHTDEVLSRLLSLGTDQLQQLRQKKVI